jgi:ABC-2 type transport system permease protein
VLSEIVRFEWRYHVGQASFGAAALLFLLLGFGLTASGFGPDNLPVNAPYLVMESLGFLSLLSVFAAAVFVSSAVLRDSEHRMAEIVYCTPVARFDFLAGRFAGAFLAALTATMTSAAGMALASFMPWLGPERAGAPGVPAYAWALLAMSVPNVLFVTALLFAVAALTRSALATYVAAIFVYVLYFIAAALTDSPLMAASAPGAGGGLATALLDPFGLSSFFEETRYWTFAEKKVRLVGLGGMFLWNRAVWVALAVALWAVVYRSFPFRVLHRTKAKTASKAQAEAPARPTAYVRVASDRDALRTWLASFVSTTGIELRTLLRSVPFLLLLILWAAMAASEIYGEVLEGEYGSRSYPATSLIVAALRRPLSLIGTVLLIYYGAEVFWREHRFRLSAVVNATPVRASAVVAAKWTALAALVACLVAVGIAAGVSIQVSQGYFRFEPALYLSLFYFVGLPLALFAAALALVHAWSPGKYFGMVIALLFAVFTQRGQMLGLEHHLFRFASAPPLAYSEMNGFGHHAAPFHGYMLLWAAVGALLALLAARLWRTVGAGIAERLRRRRRRPSPAGRALAAVLGGVAIATGGWILYNTRVLRADATSKAVFDRKADYERSYRPIATLPQPSVDAIDTEVDLFPAERRSRVAGRLGLVNRTEADIATLFVAVRREAEPVELSMPAARLAARDERFGMYRFELDEPLAPGARTELRFDLAFAERGFADDEQDNSVIENGSLLWGFRCLPTLGYRASYELKDPRERRKRGLPEVAAVSPEEAAGHGADLDTPDLDWVKFAATVSTSADQTAVAPGRLERTWERDGRRYFRYASSASTRNMFAFASARYEVERRRHRDVDVELYHHGEHRTNAPRMLDAAVASLDRFTEAFGPYPHGQLKIAEVPGYWQFGGFAMPDTVWLVETRGFLTDARDPRRVDLVTRRVAHEVAHQWWGHQLSPASGAGAAALVESLTKYSELLVLERMHGKEHVRGLLEFELDRYLAGRSREERAEVPLYEVGDQPYIFYAKGALVLYAIRDLIGEEAMNAALRALLLQHGGAAGRPTSLDLIDHLLGAAKERDRGLIEDWMKAIVLYDLRVDSAVAERREDGRYDVAVRVAASRGRFDGSGNESPLGLNEAIEIGVFSARPGDAGGSESILYLGKHEMRQGINEISVVVDEPPDRVAVDPYVLRIDKNRFDNAKRIR